MLILAVYQRRLGSCNGYKSKLHVFFENTLCFSFNYLYLYMEYMHRSVNSHGG